MQPGSTVCLETQHPPDSANVAVEGSAGAGHATVERALLRAACSCAECRAAGAAPVPEARHDLTVHDFTW